MVLVRDEPLVSVVIPTYNRRYTLGRAVGSVLQQTYRNLEVVVDDASDDGTEEAFTAIDDPRVRLIRHRQNGGGATARNTGIDAAGGALIAFLDSDDVWLPDKLARQVPFLLAQRDWGCAVSYTQVYLDTGRKRFVRPVVVKRDNEPVGDYLLVKWAGLIHTSTLLLSRELAGATRFEEGLRCHQDWDFCLRLERRGAPFRFLAEPLSIWRNDRRPDQMSRSLDPHGSAQWLERVRGSLSERAYFARRADLAPLIEDNRWAALGRVLIALRSCSIPLRICLLLLARCVNAGLYRSIIEALDKTDIFPSERRGAP